MFPYLKEIAPLVLLRWLTQTTLVQVREQQLQDLPAWQQDILWTPGFFLPSLSNQTKWYGAICGFRSRNVSALSIPRCQRIETRENSYRASVHFLIATQAASVTDQAMVQLLSSPGKRVRKPPFLFFSSKGSQCETLAWSGIKPQKLLGCSQAFKPKKQRFPTLVFSHPLPLFPLRGISNCTQQDPLLNSLPSHSGSNNIPGAIAHMEKQHEESI